MSAPRISRRTTESLSSKAARCSERLRTALRAQPPLDDADRRHVDGDRNDRSGKRAEPGRQRKFHAVLPFIAAPIR